MAKDIEPKLKLISGYLKVATNETFVIPEYQRRYSWSTDECDKLWQDIETFMDSSENDPYFFGTIIIDCSIPNSLSLIDGQQRTTTFILLLKALLLHLDTALKNMPRDEESEGLRDGLKDRRNLIVDILYKTDADSRSAIMKDWSLAKDISLLINNSINEQYKSELQNIIESPDFRTAEQNAHKIPRRQKDYKYTNFFRNFKFFYNKLNDYKETQLNSFAKTFLTKCQIIEIRSWQIEQAITMFNSLNSTGMPLSDADIISAQLYSNAGTDRDNFNDDWGNLIKLTERLNQDGIISIDSVLQEFMYINRSVTKEYIQSSGVADVTTPGIRKYYTSLHKELLEQPLNLCAEFSKIATIWDTIKNYPIIKLLLKFNENSKIFLVSYLYRYNVDDITREKVLDIAECLLRLFAILELGEAVYSSNKVKTFLFGVNIKSVDRNVPISEIKNDFDDHIRKTWKEEDIRQSILEYDKNILVFLNEYLYSKANGLQFDFAYNVNVEHIMPYSGHNISFIRTDAGFQTLDEFITYVNKLGNKMLLEDDINKSISNEWFKSKKQNSIINKMGYKDSQYNVASSMVKFPSDSWTKDDIASATQDIADRMVKFIFNK